MKKLIVYETKTGTTENCAMKIKADMDFQDVEVINLKAGNKPDLSNYDTIIVGTPIYRVIINKIIESEKPVIGLLDSEIDEFSKGI